MSESQALLHVVVAKLQTVWVAAESGINLVAIAAFLVVCAVAERFGGGRAGRYVARPARTDALYALFYVGGIYTIVVGPLIGLARRAILAYAPFVQQNVLGETPILVQAALAIVIGDGVRYWVHRWSHASPVLWAFHSVHHSQRDLGPLTNFRAHFVDTLVHSTMLSLAGLVLGPSPAIWTSVSVALLWQSLLAHTGAGVSYGVVDRVIVSPAYHRLHHATDPELHNKNFGMTFSFWDAWFGTAVRQRAQPTGYGLVGQEMPESFVRQLWTPFRRLAATTRLGTRVASRNAS